MVGILVGGQFIAELSTYSNMSAQISLENTPQAAIAIK